MKKRYGIKTILASVLVTAALATPAVVLSGDAVPEHDAQLIFAGARLEYRTVGEETTIQAIFDVSVDKVVNGIGVSFFLDYNPEYLTPSYIEDVKNAEGEIIHYANEIIGGESVSGSINTDAFFAVDPNILGVKDSDGNAISPFSTIAQQGGYYSSVDRDDNTLHMTLELDQSPDGPIAKAIGQADSIGRIQILEDWGGDMETGEGTNSYVFNLWEDLVSWDECRYPDREDYDPPKPTQIEGYDTKVTLGQISFRVTAERLPEIVRYFGEMTGDNVAYRDYALRTNRSPRVKVKDLNGGDGAETYLLDRKNTTDSWTVRAIGNNGVNKSHPHPHLFQMAPQRYGPDDTSNSKNVKEIYDFSFDKHAIIKVEATNPELTINSYQNYTEGNIGDLAISLGKYSPMVTITYADGSKENVPFPWGGRTDYATGITNTYEYTVYDDAGELYHKPYSAIGDVYRFSQKYEYVDSEGNKQIFPRPVTAKMTVTPITVIEVTADDLERTYLLGRVTIDVDSVAQLALPTQARIITDIVPAGVSLVTDLEGWKPVEGSWPDPATALTTIKGKSFDADHHEVTWPAPGASGLQAADHVGSYSFETSDKDHQEAHGVLSQAIREAYPWLTVPDRSAVSKNGKDEWDIENAKRNIVGEDDYLESTDYTAEYVSTVTVTEAGTNGYDQPTLTLAVKKRDGALADESVFRIWLPNGLEVGTGQEKGGVLVPDWFGYKTEDTADDCGFYRPAKASEGAAQTYFNLNMNPDDPNDRSKGKEHDNRETLRRYINLGGWYRVAVCEAPDSDVPVWTQPIPVYVPPRRNEYRESKIYNFIGENAGMFNWPSGIYGALYLPQGTYTPVGPLDSSHIDAQGVGLPLYWVDDDVTDGRSDPAVTFEGSDPYRPREGVTRYTESYGAKTLYDGQTGAQPGEIFTIKPQLKDSQKPWANKTGDPDGKTHNWAGGNNIYRYGPTPLYTGPYNTEGDLLDQGLQVMAFGYVHQPADQLDRYKVTVRRENEIPQPDPELREEIRLVCYKDSGITREVQNDKESNVTLVTYDTQMEGYTVRQDYTLIIKNVGDVDIYGLDIDGLTDGYIPEPTGGHFEMLQPPASFLPAGGETTFTLTYVYDLRGPKNSSSAPLVYHDRFYITSTNHPRVEKPGNEEKDRTDYLLDFDAEFTVSNSPLHKVTVVYKPGNGTMGTAGLIVGEQESGGAVSMNYTATTQTYPVGKDVYVVVNMVDEYDVLLPVLRDDTTDEVGEYKGTATLADGTKVYVFDMPDHDVTVTVNFYEPVRSKLRLLDLIEFSAPTDADKDDLNIGNDLKTSAESAPPAPHHTYQVWRKQFTKDEEDFAEDWSKGFPNSPDSNLCLMTKGSPIPHAAGYPAGGWEKNNLPVPADEGQQFISTQEHYIVIIDSDFDLSQVEATLRPVVYHEDYQGLGTGDYAQGYNKDIEVDVLMEVFPYGIENLWSSSTGYDGTVVYNPAMADPGYGPRPGLTATPSVHTTRFFAEEEENEPRALSPEKGQSTYVRITLSAPDPMQGNETVYRYYYLEIHRKTDEPDVTLQYGNSPYGMIMNEKRWKGNAGAQTEAKNAFRAAGYRFRTGEGSTSVTPDKATEHGLTNVVYWREAWVRNEGLYEPESLTGQYMQPVYELKETEDEHGNKVEEQVLKGYEIVDDLRVYDPANNLDLNDVAYFAILGEDMREPGVLEARDSAGRPVDISTISAQAEVTLLDTDATTQVGRFSGTQTATIHLGVADGNHILTFLAEHDGPATPAATKDHWPVAEVDSTSYALIENIRPGRYRIQYTYMDFDGVTELHYYRPFVILRGVGDVNTDGQRDSGYRTPGNDEYAIEDRVTDPLGYAAGKWDGTKETVYPYANIFKYRVCDVNNDRNINNIDANLVDKNVRVGGDLWLRFYEPLDYGLPNVTG